MTRAGAWLLLALLAGACGRGGDAPPAAGQLPAARLDEVARLYNRGVASMERYQTEEAVDAFAQVVALAPDWVPGRLNLALALLNEQGAESLARAEKELDWVLAVEPRHPTALYSLGVLLRHLQRDAEAAALFERVLAVDPADADAHYMLGVLREAGDPAAARAHFEAALAQAPHHQSACYRLAGLLRQAGESEAALALLDRFRELKESGAGFEAGMKYGEMGRYASVLRAFAESAPAGPAVAAPMPQFADRAAALGVTAPAGAGAAGWPGRPAGPRAASFGPGAAVADVDGDLDLDLFLAGGGADGGGALFLQDGGRFAVAAGTGLDAAGAIGAFFGDFDGDGDPDLFLTRDGPDRLFRNDGAGRFADAGDEAGVAGAAACSLGAAWADADHDGDLDLYVARIGPNALWRNDGNGRFTDVAAAAGVDGGAATTLGVLFLDADGDLDLDLYLIQDGAPNRLFLNDRVGRYHEAGPEFAALAGGDEGLAALLGDLDQDGREDLVLLNGPAPARLLRQHARGRYEEDPAFAALAAARGGAAGGALGDFDLDGDLDLLLLDATSAEGGRRHLLLRNEGGGRFAEPLEFGPAEDAPRARGAVAVDLDGDGWLEVLVARAGAAPQLWSAVEPPPRAWLAVQPVRNEREHGVWPHPGAIGLQVEVKTGTRAQVGRIASASGYLGSPPPRLHFGLGAAAAADYVRLQWPDGGLQSELEVAGGQLWQIGKVLRKPSSCPLLFCWDGARFAFVTDFLGTGGLGFFVAPGEYAPPDPTEAVRIPPAALRPRDGRYLLRVAEPLEEVSYLDELFLRVIDHPAGWEIHPDERFAAAPPFPTGRPLAVEAKLRPRDARDDCGRDVLARLLAVDRCSVEPPLDPRFAGYAREHWLELDFGDALVRRPGRGPLHLFLHGWVEYTYSHVNYAAWQAGLALQPPVLEVPDGAGGWRVLRADAGFPAGLPRTMTIPLEGLPLGAGGRLRLRTNMAISWDEIYAAEDVAGDALRIHELRPLVAELRPLGYPREYSPDGAEPTLYDYQRLDRGVPFRFLRGEATPPGDVRALLAAVDDRFAILARGQEVALEFDAAALPPPPPGWSRSVILQADGYCKDMDLYTASPDTVEPLPYHAMPGYPPPAPARQPGR